MTGAAPGDIIDKYRVEREIAHGGMSVVVAARHLTLDQTVAIKLLVRPEGLLAEEAATRFVREARAAARIESEHICKVFDVGTVGTTPYMVMEHLRGVDVETELETRGSLPPAEAVAIILQALEGLAVAHDHGIVHRDLKPANLFLAEGPDGSRRTVKVLDFGISKVEGRDAKLTDTQGSFGTPLYMSPEQVKNAKHTDARTDIWALGAILYELVSGRPPFEGETSGEVLAAVLEERHVPLDVAVPGIGPELSQIVERCLTRDREKRFSSARELAEALAPHAGPRLDSRPPIPPRSSRRAAGVSAPTLAEAPSIGPIALRQTGSGWTTPNPGKTRRTVGVVAGIVVVGLVCGGVVLERARRAERNAAVSSAGASPAAPSAESTAAPVNEVSSAAATTPTPTAPASVAALHGKPAARATTSARTRVAPPAARSSPAKNEEPKSASEILKDSY